MCEQGRSGICSIKSAPKDPLMVECNQRSVICSWIVTGVNCIVKRLDCNNHRCEEATNCVIPHAGDARGEGCYFDV